ncbi:hypothetical protein M2271_007224 [Streptomyces sp. LBL]|uniref:hypothetical protein n=1 Tax=Streptomyces sp. LBL TaxID=2940562 RepID=UPI0024742E2C|nr:hypothetical protein [Streptomyces sp. LBL]MDH6629388.1 hypothetical protein [Streptomyces sp. LBL]
MPKPDPQHEPDFVDVYSNPDLIGSETGGPARMEQRNGRVLRSRPKREHRPGEDPLPDERLAEIRAAADTPELRELLGELDRVRALLSTTLEANGTLLDNWARLEGVAPHPFLGVFCRTCRAEVQPGTEGPRHSPTVIRRALYAMHEENRSPLDAERRSGGTPRTSGRGWSPRPASDPRGPTPTPKARGARCA